MYTEAKECARAKGDSSKARRMDRGIKASCCGAFAVAWAVKTAGKLFIGSQFRDWPLKQHDHEYFFGNGILP